MFLVSILGGNANELDDADLSPSQRSLFWLRNEVPGNGLAGERDVVSKKLRGFCVVSCAQTGP